MKTLSQVAKMRMNTIYRRIAGYANIHNDGIQEHDKYDCRDHELRDYNMESIQQQYCGCSHQYLSFVMLGQNIKMVDYLYQI
jgi:hypothetical protein